MISEGFPPNSFLSHQARSHLYARSDPRKLPQQTQVVSSEQTRDASNRTDSVGSASSNEGAEFVRKSNSNKNWFEGDYPHAVYAQLKSPRGKSRIQKFNYSAFNVRSSLKLSHFQRIRRLLGWRTFLPTRGPILFFSFSLLCQQ
jgi:hypothetical protein